MCQFGFIWDHLDPRSWHQSNVFIATAEHCGRAPLWRQRLLPRLKTTFFKILEIHRSRSGSNQFKTDTIRIRLLISSSLKVSGQESSEEFLQISFFIVLWKYQKPFSLQVFFARKELFESRETSIIKKLIGKIIMRCYRT